MIAKFFASLIANLSEKLLMDLLTVVISEVVKSKKKADLSKAVTHLKTVIDELSQNQRLTDDEKNAHLIVAGRTAIDILRDN